MSKYVTADDIRRVMMDLIVQMDLFGTDEKDAVAALNYIGGVSDFGYMLIRWLDNEEKMVLGDG